MILLTREPRQKNRAHVALTSGVRVLAEEEEEGLVGETTNIFAHKTYLGNYWMSLEARAAPREAHCSWLMEEGGKRQVYSRLVLWL